MEELVLGFLSHFPIATDMNQINACELTMEEQLN